MTRRRDRKAQRPTPLPKGPALVASVGAVLSGALAGCYTNPRPPQYVPQPPQPYEEPHPPPQPPDGNGGYDGPPEMPDDIDYADPPPPQVAPPPQPPPPPPPQIAPQPPQPPQVRPPQLRSPPPVLPARRPPQPVKKLPPQVKQPQVIPPQDMDHDAPVLPDRGDLEQRSSPGTQPPLVGPFDRRRR